MRQHQLLWTPLLILACCAIAAAQGVQTGTIAGQLRSSDGQPLPGVSVTVKSAGLQGVRTTVSDGNGAYVFEALPTGDYAVRFELSGMNILEKPTTLELGSTINLDATLSLAAVEETVTVTAEVPTVLQQSTIGANYSGGAVDRLASSRTLQGIAGLAPGLTLPLRADSAPNAGQVVIAGSFAFDNVFLVNGVDVNDNLHGSANDLFIEDAVEEVQVLTSGISAEYGRFSGGVINAITKRGGNSYHGSFRVDLTNPSWRDESPLEDRNRTARLDQTDLTYQATLGGPIVADRLWFFVAGRTADTTSDTTLRVTNQSIETTQSNRRIEGKLTGSIAQRHTLQASFLDNASEQTGPSLASLAADPATFYDPPRTIPNHLFVVRYGGVLTSHLFGEAQFSQKTFRFSNSGGTSTDLVDSPIATNSFSPPHYYNAPYFDSHDPEDRDNRQLALSLSHFRSSSRFGRHDLKLGYENYRSHRTGGNSQTATGYVVYTDYLGSSGQPILDANGRFQPVFVPRETIVERWLPVRGARIDITTQSLFVNDRWQIGRWSAGLGLRYEKVRSEATGGIVGVDTDTLVPRLALAYDVRADGKLRLDATFAEYAGKYSEAQFGNNTTVGNPSYLDYLYTGPAGVGRDCAACFGALGNTDIFLYGSAPTQNIFFAPGLSSPITREITVSAGLALPRGGHLKASYVARDVRRFFEAFVDTTTGRTDLVLEGIPLGTADNVIYRNTDVPTREYRALQAQFSYRLMDAWSLSGGWTHQLRNRGDNEGASLYGQYPEIFSAERYFPLGRLRDFQADRIRVWTNYDVELGRAGRLNIGLLYRYDSSLTNSIVAFAQSYSLVQRAAAARYAAPPPRTFNNIVFGERGALEFEPEHDLDLSLRYDVPIVRRVRSWLKLDIRNLFNRQAQIMGSGSVRPDPASPLDELGLRTGYLTAYPGSTFRQATASTDYQTPREIRLSIGVWF